MVTEILVAGVLVGAGTIVLILWIDLRCATDARGLATLAVLIAASVAATSVALRATVLAFPMGSVAAVVGALTGWALVILLTTRPRTVRSASRTGEGQGR